MMTRKPKRKFPRALAVFVILALAGAGTFVYFKNKNASSTTQTATVQTAQAGRGLFRVTISGPGTLQAAQSRAVSAKVNALVESIPEVGDTVQKGQLLVMLNSRDAQQNLSDARLELQRAETTLASTQAKQNSTLNNQDQSIASSKLSLDKAQIALNDALNNYNTQQKLYTVGAISKAVLDDSKDSYQKALNDVNSAKLNYQNAQTQKSNQKTSDASDLQSSQLAVQSARASVQKAQNTLTDYKVYAPISGVVSAVSGQVGASAGGVLLTLVDDSNIKMPVQVDETQINMVKLGQRAEITLDAFPDQVFSGTVTQISPTARQENNISIFDVTLTIPNPERQLKAGMTAEAEIISEEIPNAVTIPKKAIESVSTRQYVTVQKEDGSTERLRVRTSSSDGTNVVVDNGLQGGETLILPVRVASTSNTGNRQGSGGFGGPPF